VRIAICLVGFALVLAGTVRAQSPNATVNGRVLDTSGGLIADATVEVINEGTNVSSTTRTNSAGIYLIPELPPATYRIQVSHLGFKTIVKPDVILNVRDAVAINFTLPIGAISETVTVEGGASMVDTQDASVSTIVDRQFAENLPMNGRSFQTLIQLTPGVVLTASNENDNGQFSVNGQRPASNYWMIDGVSANIGIGTSQFSAGNGLSGATAGFSVLGGTNSLVSVDAMQEFRIQTSTFAPEFGRTPGGQISIVTRSGTNQWHGSAFDYVRNDIFDSNDWFADYDGLPKPKERQNDFGGTLSGPIVKDRTFLFFSYEGLRLRLPQVAEELVPDLHARQTAIPAMQPFLNAFPLPSPNTPDNTTTGIAQFNSSYSNAATLDAYSLRIDHKLRDNVTLFGRYNYSPSTVTQRGSATLNSLTPSQITLQTGTVGMTWMLSASTVNDLRFNYSRTDSMSYTFMDAFGGGAPLTSLPFPTGFNATNAQLVLFSLSLAPYYGPDIGPQGHNLQRQFNLIENLSIQKGAHSMKFGVDFRQLSPVFTNPAYLQEALFLDVPSSASGNVSFGDVAAERNGTFAFHNLGAFAQDTWRVNRSLTMTYGLRWDVDLAPSSNPPFLAVTGFNLNNLSNLALAPSGTPPFQTTYGNVAPRIGVAYQLRQSQSWQTVLRGGFGVFYDMATSEAGNSVYPLLYPFGASNEIFGGSFPYSSTLAMPPSITAANLQSAGAQGIFDPHLKLPYTLEWDFSVEQALGASQTLSATYVGSVGRRLIQTADVSSPNANFALAQLITNAATSNYNALQLQFQRRLSNGLQALVSYTWSHSIDTASAGSLNGNENNALTPTDVNQNRGPSDFDIRNALSLGLTYDLSVRKINAPTDAILQGWSLDNVFQATSALPITVTTGNFEAVNLYNLQIRPDVVPGEPLYLYGSQCASTLQMLGELAPAQRCPGGKALNPSAFVGPPAGQQGDLGRNALRGFGAWQWDLAVHREFPIHESLKLQFRAEMFNVLNHPNFAPFSNLTNTSQFGLSTQTLGNYLAGSSLGTGGFSSLYQIGGPRSIQLALKLVF
jgi:hypothetical protein